MLKIEFDEESAQAALSRLMLVLSNTAPAMKEIGERLMEVSK